MTRTTNYSLEVRYSDDDMLDLTEPGEPSVPVLGIVNANTEEVDFIYSPLTDVSCRVRVNPEEYWGVPRRVAEAVDAFNRAMGVL